MAEEIRILPPLRGHCPACGAVHEAEQPHEPSSMLYLMRFFYRTHRLPTWWDAMAHCSDALRRKEIMRMLEQTPGMDPEGWVPVTDTMPTESDADQQGCVEVWHVYNHVMIMHHSQVALNSFVVAWRRTPRPPQFLCEK